MLRMDTGSLLRCKRSNGVHDRFWEIDSIVLGATHQESVVGIKVINMTAPCDDSGHLCRIMYVPIIFIEMLVANGNIHYYEAKEAK